MPASLVWIWSMILTIIVPLVAKIIFALGIGYVVFRGVNDLLSNIVQSASFYFNQLPSGSLSIMGMMGLDVAFNVIISAYVIRIAIKGLNRAQLAFNPKT